MGEIEDGVRRYEDRKEAVYKGDRDSGSGAIDTEVMRTLLVGLDLDIEELAEYRVLAAQAALEVFKRATGHIGAHAAFVHTMAGTWVDGIITGLLIAQAREKAEVADEGS